MGKKGAKHMPKEYTLRFTEEELRVIQAALETGEAQSPKSETGTEEPAQTENGIVNKILNTISRFL